MTLKCDEDQWAKSYSGERLSEGMLSQGTKHFALSLRTDKHIQLRGELIKSTSAVSIVFQIKDRREANRITRS